MVLVLPAFLRGTTSYTATVTSSAVSSESMLCVVAKFGEEHKAKGHEQGPEV